MSEQASIVVCDDIPKTREDLRDELEALAEVSEAFEVVIVDKDAFEHDVQLLEKRRDDLRQGRDLGAEKTVFDSASILVVDYDLYEYMPEQLLTGDSVAYLARSFSSCGYIVGVNQDRIPNPFDVTLVAHQTAPTDLSIGGDQVADRGLWSGNPANWGQFRPWAWPVLPTRAGWLESQAAALAERLDAPLHEVMGLPRAILDSLPRNVVGLLDVPERPDIAEVTLRDWVHGARMGLRVGDVLEDPQQIARVAAARLGKWFESVLLPGQDVLIDAPHLVERRPGLLRGNSADPGSWAPASSLCGGTEASGIELEGLADHLFAADWLSRPAWLWSEISVDSALDATVEAERPSPPLAFAEDASRFIAVEDGTRFTSDVDSPFNSRWLAVPADQPTYLPAARLTTG